MTWRPGRQATPWPGTIETITEDRGAAGVLLVVGILGALYAASGYIGAFIRASNVIYEVEEGRPFYKLRPLQVGVTVIMVVAVGLVISAMVLSGPLAGAVGDAVGLSDAAVTVYGVAKWPILALLVMGILGPPVLRLAQRPDHRRALGHARQPAGARRCGWRPRRCSPSTCPTSAPTTRPTAPSAAP